ncbi:MAG: hypothetical protein JWQ24_684 [Tardiphaga sp.]|nr:hypothetical protein [Tardiphaga sp.]
MSDHRGVAPIYPMLPDAETIVADKGYDRDAFETLSPDAASRLAFHHEPSAGAPAMYCKTLYRQRHKVANMFAICIAATVIFWLGQ